MIRDKIGSVLEIYLTALIQTLKNHPIAEIIRKDIPSEIRGIIENKERYKIQGSPGQGNWNTCPWVAIFDVLVTRSAQSGYYPVFLFCEDMSGLYFSMNQGVTEIKNKYKRDAKTVLKDRAKDFRNQLGQVPDRFPLVDIDLKTLEGSRQAPFYEAGNIFAKYYPGSDLPDDEEIKTDIKEMLKVYNLLVYNEGLPVSSQHREDDHPENYQGVEDLKRFTLHKRIERNQTLIKKEEAEGI